MTEAEADRGSTARAACNTKTKLVEAKLEMVRAAWLFHCGAPVSGVRWINSRDLFSAMKSTDVYKDALARAKADPAVIEALGSPIKDGFLVSGNTNVNGASGESNLAIPISGPKGQRDNLRVGKQVTRAMELFGLVVEVGQTHERIDLLQKSAPINSP